MSELARLKVWNDPAISAALAWYLDVAENRRPAKFRIAATLATPLDLATAPEETLWAELDRLTPIFYPVLEWISEYVPEAPVNVMAQFHPDNFCDPASAKYRDKYAEIARRPTHLELERSCRRARELGLQFETTTFERRGIRAMLEM